MEKAASVGAREARAAGLHWTFAPMVDIARDPRWGRIAEGTGEDPYLGARIAEARVRGFQGKDLSRPDKLLSCLKHFAAYGAAEAGRDYNTVDISEKRLREIYLPPFKAGIEQGAMSVMTSFNSLNGIPTTGSRFLLTDILRGEWGFEGFVVSDMEAIPDMIVHGFSADKAEAAQSALLAGVDMEMENFEKLQVYADNLAPLVQNGKVPEKSLDEAVKRILMVKCMLGLFEKPYVDPELEAEVVLSEKHIQTARDMARASIVLLKNDNHLLPLKPDIGSIALIGPLANTQQDHLGGYSCAGKPDQVVSVLEGIKGRVSQTTKIRYVKGCGIYDDDYLKGYEIPRDDTDEIEEAVEAARQSDVAVLVLGEHFWMSCEAGCRTNIDIPGRQKELLKAVFDTGTPVVAILMSGRPLILDSDQEKIPAILAAWHLGITTGNAVADVIFGDYNPSGKLAVTFPRNVGQLPLYYNHDHTGKPKSDTWLTPRY